MGKLETSQPPPLTRRNNSRVVGTLLFILGTLATLTYYYKGVPIRMISKETPYLELREIYVRTTPQPPASLQSLTRQNTRAGQQALYDWYEDQARQARKRGYNFPFRLSRWTNTKKKENQMTVNSGGVKLALMESGLTVQRTDRVMTSQDRPIGVSVNGTGRMLREMRNKYLSGRHGGRFSYWSDTPTRQAAGNKLGRWEYYVDDGLVVPNITHKPTLVHLARMTANAYRPVEDVGSDTWEQLGDRWDTDLSFGWEEDGMRGHIFADKQNTTVVVSLKGTSSTFFLGGGSETSVRDKYNDNRLFSCCCGYVDFTWSTVCDCHMSGSKCNQTCLQNTLNDEAADNYFYAAAQIFMDVVGRYPEANIVLAGHSLGGTLATLLGLTFGVPAIAIDAPGDLLAAKRMHLPVPHRELMHQLPLFHVGNTADPIFMGACSGRTSSCYYAGYAMESKCHSGRQLVFDTVGERGWRLDIRHHRINEVIYLVLEPWEKGGFPVLEEEDEECVDCGLWKFIDEDSPQ